jgi:hypothetical protein
MRSSHTRREFRHGEQCGACDALKQRELDELRSLGITALRAIWRAVPSRRSHRSDVMNWMRRNLSDARRLLEASAPGGFKMIELRK